MDRVNLAALGKVAGIGGIALGVALLVLKGVLGQAGSLPDPLRGWLLGGIAASALVIGVIGMVLWWADRAQFAHTRGAESKAHNIDRSKGGGAQVASTRGDRSPAINERGK